MLRYHYKNGVKQPSKDGERLCRQTILIIRRLRSMVPLERIMIQKFYALFFTIIKQWFRIQTGPTCLKCMSETGVRRQCNCHIGYKYPSILQR